MAKRKPTMPCMRQNSKRLRVVQIRRVRENALKLKRAMPLQVRQLTSCM